ncbi:OLC1v1027935C3 [Oldenlandia corymbosa var. corymbosa]|uniref:OLC1v1027935C3 n=1 Tax=Oldenlandia corymbosa var. corymbosa TaxID=529605 RepID=A0AAV1CAK6_OLDCO|nr:OLC1v1027935C3 [Oldenlandia corymbosa var. corymbosa]
MDHYGGGSWTMISNVQNHGVGGGASSNPSTPSSSNPHHHHHHQQHDLYTIQQQAPPQQQFYQQRVQQQQQPPHQSLSSHFHLSQLVENLAEVTENGSRDQHSDALVSTRLFPQLAPRCCLSTVSTFHIHSANISRFPLLFLKRLQN